MFHLPEFLSAVLLSVGVAPTTPSFFELHSQKNILCEWYSYLETVTLGFDKLLVESDKVRLKFS